MLILFKHHRTLDIAKTVIKEKSYVYSKTDQIICLFKDGKLEEVVCVLLNYIWCLFVVALFTMQEASTMTCNPTGVALENFYFSLLTLVMIFTS